MIFSLIKQEFSQIIFFFEIVLNQSHPRIGMNSFFIHSKQLNPTFLIFLILLTKKGLIKSQLIDISSFLA